MTLYTPFFLLGFLPLSLCVYYALPRAARAAALAVISLVFYGFAAGKSFYVLPILTLLCYVLSFLPPRIGFFIMLLLLPVTRILGISAAGISFFLLRAAAYLRDEVREKNLFRLFAFLLFFPTLSAGPITRYGEIRRGLACDINYTCVERGIFRLLFGLLQKLFFADTLYTAFDRFLLGTTALSAWLALFCYALYIYFDFAGYSNIAVGLSALFGFELPENFDFPYLSRSIGEFFRRWHISLGKWLCDYVYIPLGGSRCGRGRTLLALGAVWTTSALWHGFTLSYLLWGGYFFCLLATEKLLLPTGVHPGRIRTLLLILLGWVFFFSETPTAAFAFFSRMLSFGNTLLYCRADVYRLLRFAPFLLVAVVLATPILQTVLQRLCFQRKWVAYPLAGTAAVLVVSCLAQGAHRPFLYAAF